MLPMLRRAAALVTLLAALALAPPASATVIVAPDWSRVPDGTRAASESDSSPAALPGLSKTPWNIRRGGPYAQIETVDGRKALHFHIPAGYRNDSGDTANAARAEQTFAMPAITPGQTVCLGMDFRHGPYPSRPAWNLARQFKNDGTGSPAASLDVFSGQATGDVNMHSNLESHPFTSTALEWQRIVTCYDVTKGPGTGSTVTTWVDGAQVMRDTDWRSDSSFNGGGQGGLIQSNKSSAYLKFGVYGSAPMSFPRDHWFANLIVATTRDEAMGAPAAPATPAPEASWSYAPEHPVIDEPVAFTAATQSGDTCEWADRPPGSTASYPLGTSCSMSFTFRNPGMKYVALRITRDGKTSEWTYRDGSTTRAAATGIEVTSEPVPEPTPDPDPDCQ